MSGNVKVLALIALVMVGAFTLDSIVAAWGEHRFIAAFAENFSAAFLSIGLPMLVLPSGAAIGIWIARRTGKNWLGWVVGVAFVVVILGLGHYLASNIPGVSWRYELMEQLQYD